MRYSPRVNYAFKKLFGLKENKKLLKYFMNLFLPADEQLIDFVFMESLLPFSEMTKYTIMNAKEVENIWTKIGSFHITGIDEKGRLYNFQIQLSDNMSYDQEMLMKLVSLYFHSQAPGEREIQKTIGIHIMNFDFQEEREDYHIQQCLETKEKDENTKPCRYHDDLEVHYIVLPKFKKNVEELESKLDYWTYFLTKGEEYERNNIPEIFKTEPELIEAFEALEGLYLDGSEEEIYERELKELRDG
jgi:predicted transposase/invertase (TIGR01784 family)